MVFLSSVVYPVSTIPPALHYIAYLMLLTYTIEGLRQTFSSNPSTIIFIDALVLLMFFTLFILPAIKLLQRRFV
jgi:ABC-type multidrug transport system permease subunit